MKLVLIVDDDPMVREYLRRLLRTHGYETVEVDSAEAGASFIENVMPDLILCDIVMPGIGGMRWGEQLKADPGTAMIPVVLMSGDPPGYDKRAWSPVCDDCISKAEVPESVIAAVEHFVGKGEEQG